MNNSIRASLSAGIIALIPFLVSAGVFEVTTTDGTGGKSGYIRNPLYASVFGGTLLIVKNTDGTSFSRKGYIRFDTSGLDFEPTEATLTLTVSTIDSDIADEDQFFYVYGITNQALDLVALTNGLAWSNAPANDPASWHEADLDEAELLGTFVLDYDGDYAAPIGTVIEFRNQALLDFIAADTNGIATFLIGRTRDGGLGGASASKDLNFSGDTHGTYFPPKLTCGNGSLTMTDLGTGTVNISDLGRADWKIWSNADLTPDEQMAGGSGLGGLSFSSSSSLGAGNSAFSLLYSWTNGNPTASAISNDVNHLSSQANVTNAVFSTSVTATPATNAIYVTFGQWNARSEISATLADGSTSSQTMSFTNSQHQTVRIEFASGGREKLNVSIRFVDDLPGTSSIRFQSLALANAIPPGPTLFLFK